MISAKQGRRALVALAVATALALPGTALAAGGRPPGTGHGRGGGSETSFGNNLSNPVVFASDVGVLGVLADSSLWNAPWTGLRIPPTQSGQFTQPETFTLPDGNVTVWPQAMEGNSWQATWLRNSAGTSYGTVADWGDNILGSNGAVKAFATNTAIRVEVKLTPASAPTFPEGSVYMPMISNGLSGSAEKWAAQQDSMAPLPASPTTTVFTGGAYLDLFKLDATRQNPDLVKSYPVSVTFVSTTESESGGTTGGTAPMRLAGEVNASGSVVYGLNLFPQQVPMTPGYYMLTFGILPTFNDNAANGVTLPSNATLTDVVLSDQGAGRATFANGVTSVVIQITSSTTGRRGGGGGSGSGGGGGGH